ncbi:MAG: nucleotide pyrophosphohydrolase [Candidatus Spechtbacterales bacterium]
MSDIENLKNQIKKFVEDRDWNQFHNPKDLAISLVLESTEFLELFQWKSEKEIGKLLEEKREDIEDELADVLYWVLLISNNLDIDLNKALEAKIEKNAEKYPVEKAKGTAKKYTEL